MKKHDYKKEKGRLIKWDANGILASKNAIREGNLVSFPTETVYGIGADATNAEAPPPPLHIPAAPYFNPRALRA